MRQGEESKTCFPIMSSYTIKRRVYVFVCLFVCSLCLITSSRTVIVIVNSKLQKRYSKAKRTRAPAYSRALRRIKGGFPKGVKRSSGPNTRVPGGDRVD